ncbi:peptidylprolyl isomerase, partial [bacterium]|nr:peptidylprolyl isomerase [bacterium]
SHILVKTKEESMAILQQLNSGADFAKLAKENSTCPSKKKGGDLGFFSEGQMVKPFEKAAFALNPKEITKEPVQTQFGWHIIKLTDKKSAIKKPFTEVKGEIRNILLHDKQKQRLKKLAAKAGSKYKVSKNMANINNF